LTQQPTTGRSSGATFASAASATRLTNAVAWAGRSPSAFAICFGALPRSLISRTRASNSSSHVVTITVWHFRVTPCEEQGAPSAVPS
jgi:hypothetical protein